MFYIKGVWWNKGVFGTWEDVIGTGRFDAAIGVVDTRLLFDIVLMNSVDAKVEI
jgi:hypothetical protein